MKSIILALLLFISFNLHGQYQVGWEVGVIMTHRDFTTDLGNNYNQRIGGGAAGFFRLNLDDNWNLVLKGRLSSERISISSKFANQQIYLRFIPTIEYDIFPAFSASLGMNGGFKISEYSYDFYGQIKQFNKFALNENRANLGFQVGMKYTKERAFIFANFYAEALSNLEQLRLGSVSKEVFQQGGYLEIGLGYYVNKRE